MSDRWENGDKLLGERTMTATVSKHGMCAFHTSAAAMTPDGDFFAVCGKTHKMGLFSGPEPDGRVDIRPGCEDEVRAQLDAFYGRKSERPPELQPQSVDDKLRPAEKPEDVFGSASK